MARTEANSGNIYITTQAHDIIWLFTVLGKLKMKSSYTNSIFFSETEIQTCNSPRFAIRSGTLLLNRITI